MHTSGNTPAWKATHLPLTSANIERHKWAVVEALLGGEKTARTAALELLRRGHAHRSELATICTQNALSVLHIMRARIPTMEYLASSSWTAYAQWNMIAKKTPTKHIHSHSSCFRLCVRYSTTLHSTAHAAQETVLRLRFA